MYLLNKPSCRTQRFLRLLVSAYVQAIIRPMHYLERVKKNTSKGVLTNISKMHLKVKVQFMYLLNKPSCRTQRFLGLLVYAYVQAIIRPVQYLERVKKKHQQRSPNKHLKNAFKGKGTIYVFIEQTVMQNTAISRATSFCIRIGHHQTCALFRTREKNHTIVH